MSALEPARPWTKAERELLMRMHWQNRTRAEMAQALNRSVASVGRMALHLGARVIQRDGGWSNEDLDLLWFRFRKGDAIAAIADDLGRTVVATKARLETLKRKQSVKPMVSAPYKAPAYVENNHIAHCVAVLRADVPGKPAGYGFPFGCDR